jgi:FixJ family two-component response regulator
VIKKPVRRQMLAKPLRKPWNEREQARRQQEELKQREAAIRERTEMERQVSDNEKMVSYDDDDVQLAVENQ